MNIYPNLEAHSQTGNRDTACDTDLVLVFQDAHKKPLMASHTGLYAESLEKLSKSDSFTAACGATQFVRFGGQSPVENVLFLGVGPAGELTEEKLRSAGGQAYQKLKSEKCKCVAVQLNSVVGVKGAKTNVSPEKTIRTLAEGLSLGAYEFTKYKTLDQPTASAAKKKLDFCFITANKSLKAQAEKQLAEVSSAAETLSITRNWSNEPSNIGTPEFYANEAKKFSKQYGLKCRVLNLKDCRREKMNLFLSVGQGSSREGCVVVVEYTPKAAKKAKKLALVGKGVTFDSGGISIKPSLKMEDMKHDMTGAATVFGAIALAAKWKCPNQIVAIMAFTENMPDASATQPGNIVTARNGKTVEILNTDAEGRLVLADALDFAHEFKPDAIINIATLTGACSIALGRLCCAVLGNDESLIASLRKAGEKNGERMWQLPLFDEYLEDMKSPVADLRNVANDSLGGTIRGGIFLKQFIRKGMKWAHLDIASTAYDVPLYSYIPKKGASGFYVRTLAQYACDF